MPYKYLLKASLLVAGLTLPAIGHAADYELHNAVEKIISNWASATGDLLIGPQAAIVVDGDWYITAHHVYIHPSASITGTGTIHLMTPATFGTIDDPTILDAGGVNIGCKLSVENDNQVRLQFINIATAYPGVGFTDSHLPGTDDLLLDNNLNFTKVGAHIALGASNVILNAGAVAVPTYAALGNPAFPGQPANISNASQAYLITTGTGAVIKRSIGNNESFLFPVGQSAASDYTPANITNTGTTRHFNVQVYNYANSSSVEGDASVGVDRTWHIASNLNGTANLRLTNNAASEGGAYVRNSAFISQQYADGIWDVVAGGAAILPDFTHVRNGLTVGPESFGAYFTKASSEISGNAQVDIVVGLQANMQGSGIMRTDLQNYFGGNDGLLPVESPYKAFAEYGRINNPGAAGGLVSDWVMVEIRDAVNPANVLQERSLLLKPDGHITETNGAIPIFNGHSGRARIAVHHRNHLAILSNPVSLSAFLGTKAYNFTTALAQASNDFSDPPQMRLVGTKWCMWTGDVNSDLAIDATDYGQVFATNSNAPFDIYEVSDLNMDGSVDATDVGLMFSSNSTAPYSTLLNY